MTFNQKLNVIGTSEKLELGLLALLVFFLPLRETPKTLCLLLYLFFWLFNRRKNKDWGTKDLFFDLPLIFIIFAGLISSALSPFDQIKSFDKSLDFSFAALLAICIRRAAYQVNITFKILLIALVLGISVALVEGLTKGKAFPYLRSVGHINQVANYLVIAFAIVFSTVISIDSSTKQRIFGVFSIFFLVAAFATQSRNAAFAIAIVIFVTILATPRENFFKSSIFFRGIIFLIIGTVLLFSSNMFEKQLTHLSRGSIDTERFKLWGTALTSAEDRPFLGYGPGTFESATSQSNLERLAKKNNREFRSDDFFQSSHGHNFLIHWVTERGLISLFFILFWIFYLLRASFLSLKFLYRSCVLRFEQAAPTNESISSQVLFGISVAVLAVGIGNTSLRVEHGLLAMLFAGLAYSGAKTKPKTA